MATPASDAEASVFGLPSAPIFHPTPEEFRDPWAFLNSVRHIIKRTGICVVQPPSEEDGWDFSSFEKYVDPKEFTIVTKAQNVHQMQQRSGPTVSYTRDLMKFWEEHGRPLTFLPEVNGIVVDFFRLKHEVDALGGFDKVEEDAHWPTIAGKLRLLSSSEVGAAVTLHSNTLRNHYVQYLHPFLTGKVPAMMNRGKDTNMRTTRQQERAALEQKTNGPVKLQKKCGGCNVILQFPETATLIKCPRCSKLQRTADLVPVKKPVDQREPEQKPALSQTPSAPQMATMRCISSKCKNVLLQYPLLTTVQIKCPKCLTVMKVPPIDKAGPPPKLRSATPPPPVKNELSEPKSLKRSLERSKEESQKDSPLKRRKKDEPLWKQVKSRSFAKDEKNESESDSEEEDEDGSELAPMSTASRRGGMMGGGRMGMMGSKINDDPTDSLAKDFGYDMGYSYSLEAYQSMADAFEDRWSNECKTPQDKERTYWRIVEKGEEWVHVQYGSDLDVAKHGSGFPLNPHAREKEHARRARFWEKARKKKRKPAPTAYMTRSGWNTNNLAEATFLHHLNENVAGVTRPMMYVGMLFSSFCWHVEDNYLYSINYLHTGAWYGIPYEGADAFEKTMRAKLPDLFAKTPNLLHLLVTQFSPRILQEAGVPVYTALQKKGQFVITSPRAYHSGFNTGFNVAESVNFALEDWLPMCRRAVDDYRFHRSAVVPYEEFVLKAAKNPDSPGVAELVRAELVNVIAAEQKALSEVFALGIQQFVKSSDAMYQPCHHCGYDCYLSGVVCNEHRGTVACLRHAADLCACDAAQKRLLVRVPLAEIKETLDAIDEYLQTTKDEDVHGESSGDAMDMDKKDAKDNEAPLLAAMAVPIDS